MSTTPIFVGKCRLCLKNPGTVVIFDEENLSADISFFTGIKVTCSDNLPQNICSKCLTIIINAKELKELATKNDSYLHAVLEGDSDTETLVIDEYRSNIDNSVTNDTHGGRLIKSLEEERNPTTTDSPIIAIRKDLFKNTPLTEVSTTTNKKNESKKDDFRISKTLKFETDRVFEFECEACNKAFDTRKKLYLHERVHNKKFGCPIEGCGKLFSTKGDLAKHLRIHTGVKPYECNICDKKFTQKVTLKLHKENVHYEFNVT